MMGVYVMDHCANCANAWNCDQSMKGRFCPGFIQDQTLRAIKLRPATPEDIEIRKKMRFSANFAKMMKRIDDEPKGVKIVFRNG